jgi:transcription elongation factor Elf1
MPEKKLKRVCTCVNCGNESEMTVTCSLDEVASEAAKPAATEQRPVEPQRVKGTATCSHCGNEADMWIDM